MKADGKKLTKAQRDLIVRASNGMSFGGMTPQTYNEAVSAERLRERGLLKFFSGRHRYWQERWYAITEAGRSALSVTKKPTDLQVAKSIERELHRQGVGTDRRDGAKLKQVWIDQKVDLVALGKSIRARLSSGDK